MKRKYLFALASMMVIGIVLVLALIHVRSVHSDGSLEEYLLAPGTVNAFLKNLPKGDKLELKMPPPSLLTNPEPSFSTEVP